MGYSFNADDTRAPATGQKTGFATGDNNRALTTGLRYANGPLALVATYDRFNPTNAAEGGNLPRASRKPSSAAPTISRS